MNTRRLLTVARPVALLVLAAVVLATIVPVEGLPAMPVRAASPVNWQFKNFSMPAYGENDYLQSAGALQQLADAGATSVTFVPNQFQTSESSAVIFRTASTATDDSLRYAIREAKARGLQVVLKPHLDPQNGVWRAMIDPADINTWFTNYRAFLNHYLDIAIAENATLFCIGAELITVSTNPAYEARWRSLIANLRSRYSGKLTYSANWGGEGFNEEYPDVPFWDSLDYLGISAYFDMASTNTPTVAGMKARWDYWRDTRILPFQQRWNKPVLFTEGGYRSVDGAARAPWDAYYYGTLDHQEQADCYEALFQAWATTPWFAGGMFWWWSYRADVSPQSHDYEVQNKPAYQVVKAYFGGSTATATATATATRTPTATSTSTLTATATATRTPTATAIPVRPTTTAIMAGPESSGSSPVSRRLSAASGSTTGGTRVTITGTNFQSGATVTFGGAAATAVQVTDNATITATTTEHAAGTVDVIVTNPNGQSTTMQAAYTFVPPNFVPTGVSRQQAPTPTAPVGGVPLAVTETPRPAPVRRSGG